jgi:hypothetical protein
VHVRAVITAWKSVGKVIETGADVSKRVAVRLIEAIHMASCRIETVSL